MKRQAVSRFLILLTIAILIGACWPVAGGITPTATLSILPATATMAAGLPTTTAALTAPGIPDAPLSTNGPWLVFTTSDGIYATNPDASGLTHLLPIQLSERNRSTLIASAQNGLIAFLSQGDREHDLTLTIYSIPGRSVVQTIDLTSAVPDVSMMDDAMMAVRAISDHDAIAFSPDGSKLAFMGVLDGPSSDLYLYDISQDTITRLTDGPSQGFDPHWSPNGIYIVHFGAAAFGSGAGYLMEGAWAARADDSGVITLYDPSDQNAEEFIGWVDDTTFLVNSWNPRCGSNALRAFDIETLSGQVLWTDAFDDIVYHQASGTLAIAIGSDYGSCNPQGRLGVFLVHLDGAPTQLALSGEIRYLGHDEYALNIIAIVDPLTLVEVFPDGRTMTMNSPPMDFANPIISPDGQWEAWPGGEFWIGARDPAMQPVLILAEDIVRAIWSPDSSAVVLIGRDALYVAYAPEFIALPLPDRLEVGRSTAVWAFR